MMLNVSLEVLLAVCMFFGAVLYTSVGHAGASAYIALMALFGIAPAVMRPTALALNILVASFTSIRFVRAKMFRWRVLWPFLVGAIPMAFLGGAIQLPGTYYRPIVGVVLLIGAIRLLWPAELGTNREPRDPPEWAGVLGGAGIGLLSGLTWAHAQLLTATFDKLTKPAPALDRDHHLIQVPAAVRLWTPRPQPSRDCRARR
jgi:uncharacterized protein